MTAEIARATEARMRAAGMSLGWKVPFFMPVHARIEYRADQRIPTACIDLKGVIRANPDFIKTLDDQQLPGVIAHELMHLLLLHHDRRGDRKPFKWNRCTDKIVNTTLMRVAKQLGSGSFTLPPNILYAKEGQEDWTAEQLYQEEEDWPEDDLLYDPSQVPVGQGCGPLPPGHGLGSEDENDDENGRGSRSVSKDTLRRKWREIAAQAQMFGRQAGDVAGDLLADLLDIPPPRVRWAEVLRSQLHRAMAEAGVDDVSWSRRSRRSTLQIILPGGVTYKCKVAVVIDTSGSMSDDDLKQAVAETERIVNHTRVSTFLVVHDHGVREVAWIRPGARTQVHAQITKKMKGRGGTSFDEAYERVGKEGKFNVMVHLTDGEVGRWPEKPQTVRRLVIALLGSKCKSEVPDGARVIDAEL